MRASSWTPITPRSRARAALVLAGLSALAALAGCSSAVARDEPDPPAITVTITSPAPGAELLSAQHPSIVVSGTVATTDAARGALEAWVNGVRVDLVAGAFETKLTPELGINHIKVEGGDGTGALVGKELDVMWAPDYLAPLPGQTGFDVAGALELRLGQRFFDARLLGTLLDMSTDPVVARDVASAVELILKHIDLAALVEGTFGTGTPLEVTIERVTPSNIVVDARVVDGPEPAIDLKISLLGVFLALDGRFTFNRDFNIDGGITTDLHASARLTLGNAEDGTIQVAATGITASIGSLVPGFEGEDGDALDSFIAIAGHAFSTLIEGVLADAIPQLTEALPDLLETLLGTADQLLDDIRFTLDTGLGTPVELQLDGTIGALDIRAGATSGHVTVRQNLAVRTTGAPIHAASRGAPRLDVSTEAPVLNTSGVHLMMRQDFLNALLHALWNAGMLDGPLTSGGLSANVRAKLPPVVRPTPASSPCKIDGERCDLLLQLGQVEVELPGFNQSFGINATAGARINVEGGTVSIAIQMMPDLRVWDTSAEQGTLTPDAVDDLIGLLVWPKLFGALGDNLAITLPLPDLSALGFETLPPALASAQLSLQMRQRPSIGAGRLILGADLTLATPVPAP
jgi:hypothetical protein